MLLVLGLGIVLSLGTMAVPRQARRRQLLKVRLILCLPIQGPPD